tara:strand:+ start:519 stop:623 length:105 start_codon:yes stop_codon:yes gene_type:complete
VGEEREREKERQRRSGDGEETGERRVRRAGKSKI